MHIPDGFLSLPAAAAAGALSVGGLGIALHHARRHLPPRRMPLLGLTAAFVFAAQMLNFPVMGGTSGHLVGGVMTAVLVGPAAAVVVLTVVLTVQCLVFADGGLLALGANIFNMALAGAVGGWFIYRGVARLIPGRVGQLAGVAFASWCATVISATACAAELALSGTVAWATVFPVMAGVHMLIGLGEGLIATLVVAAILRLRPELAAPLGPAAPVGAASPPGADAPARRPWTELALGLVIALGLAVFISPFACGWDDGLEWAAAEKGFDHHAVETPLLPSPIPDYVLPGVPSAVATSLAGAVGTLIVFLLALALARAVVAAPSRVSPARTD